MTDYTKLGTEIGDLVTKKNEAYGDSFAKAGDFLRLLWPTGIPLGREDDALLLVRIFDKQMRVATDPDAFGESPYIDIAGYGLLGAALHERTDARCGSASADAEDEPKAQPASPPPGAAAPTTTNADALKPRSSSGGCFPRSSGSPLGKALQDAFAQTATAGAPGAEEGRPGGDVVSWSDFIDRCVEQNAKGRCAQCCESIIGEEDRVVRFAMGFETVKVHVIAQCFISFIERCRELQP